MNHVLVNALHDIAPVRPDVYPGTEKTYITVNYSTAGDDFADDAPGIEVLAIQAHYFCPRHVNAVQARKQIKRRLFRAGCTWPREINASDEHGQHYVFECEYAEGVDMNG